MIDFAGVRIFLTYLIGIAACLLVGHYIDPLLAADGHQLAIAPALIAPVIGKTVLGAIQLLKKKKSGDTTDLADAGLAEAQRLTQGRPGSDEEQQTIDQNQADTLAAINKATTSAQKAVNTAVGVQEVTNTATRARITKDDQFAFDANRFLAEQKLRVAQQKLAFREREADRNSQITLAGLGNIFDALGDVSNIGLAQQLGLIPNSGGGGGGDDNSIFDLFGFFKNNKTSSPLGGDSGLTFADSSGNPNVGAFSG